MCRFSFLGDESSAYFKAPVLSSSSVIGLGGINSSSVRKDRIHAASAAAALKATYSASVVPRATTDCSFKCQITGALAKKKTYPVVLLAISRKPTKLKSTAPNRPKSLNFRYGWSLPNRRYRIERNVVPFKYCGTRRKALACSSEGFAIKRA